MHSALSPHSLPIAKLWAVSCKLQPAALPALAFFIEGQGIKKEK